MVKSHTSCRVCYANLEDVIDFKERPLANGFLEPKEAYPLALAACEDCGLYQLKHVVEPNVLFADYIYNAGSGGMQQQMFADLAKACNPTAGGLVVDIGCNDGSLLAEFDRFGAKTVGIDPYSAEDNCIYAEPWGNTVATTLATDFGHAKTITCTNTWAHLDNLHDAAFGVSTLLENGGSFVIQVPWVRDMLNNTLYDTIYHEHLSYFGVKQLRRLFQRHWLDVYHVDYLPDVHGGTIRCWVGHGNSRVDKTVKYAEALEQSVPSPSVFTRKLTYHQEVLRDCLGEEDWAMYGCSAKGTMLVNLAGLKPVEAVDDTPEKQGLKVPGTDLTITDKPTRSNVLITAWNYADRIKAKLPEGTKVCIPFPIPRIEYV